MYEGPAGERVKVHYCRDFESSERIAKLFLDGDVIGFDLEWKANVTASKGPRQNVSLIQVASEHRIALFHLALFEGGDRPQDLVPPTLRYIMETAKITKVGVAIKADCTRLRNFLDIDARGLFELSHLYKLVKYSTIDASQINKRLVSLAQQVQEHLQLPLWKGEVRYSDWSQPLDMQQIEYAASDPYACLHLFDALERKRSALNPCPPRPYHAELDMPIRLADGATIPTLDEDNYDDISTLDVDEENDTSSIDTVASTLAAQHLSPTSPPPSSSSPDSLVQFAQAFAEARRALPPRYSHPYPRATVATLRAYYLWHEHGLAPKEVAKRLRSPPLRETTVLTYIVEAIRLDDLDYDKVRLRHVMLALGDGARRVVRYKRLWAVVDK
ncbi:MAG: hypothetical protein M1825_004583 [Sarcosagium campestre]|nr:MAG: hypothetical protein M1825_004583 [Sarcosagium campestre]